MLRAFQLKSCEELQDNQPVVLAKVTSPVIVTVAPDANYSLVRYSLYAGF